MDAKFDKPVSSNEPGVLARLWRKIITENNLTHNLNMLINRYLENSSINQRVKNLKRKNRSTLIDNITASEMSIKTFLYLIFRLLRAKKLDISIKVTFPNGRESIHGISIDGSYYNDNEESDNDIVDISEVKKEDT